MGLLDAVVVEVRLQSGFVMNLMLSQQKIEKAKYSTMRAPLPTPVLSQPHVPIKIEVRSRL